MRKLLQEISDYIAAHPPEFSAVAACTILNAIYGLYNEAKGMDNDEIKRDFDMLYSRMHGYPLREIDKIIDVVCSLCREHEKAGFAEGVKIGVRLKQELMHN